MRRRRRWHSHTSLCNADNKQPCAIASLRGRPAKHVFLSVPFSRGYFLRAVGPRLTLLTQTAPGAHYTHIQRPRHLLSFSLYLRSPGLEGSSFGLMIPMSAARGHSLHSPSPSPLPPSVRPSSPPSTTARCSPAAVAPSVRRPYCVEIQRSLGRPSRAQVSWRGNRFCPRPRFLLAIQLVVFD